MLEWVAMSSFKRSSQPRGRTQVSRIMGRFFTIWATREVRRGFQAKSNRVLSSTAMLGDFPGGASGKKKPACQCRLEVKDLDSTPGLARKIPWRRKHQPTPVFFPEESRRQGAWQAAILGSQSQTWLKRLSMHACTAILRQLKKKSD